MVKSRQRSRRKDPEQEAIVQVKDEINERMSKLIDLLKEVKKGLNGGPAPEVGVPEKVNLTQPMPDTVPSAGDATMQELSAIINGIHKVDQMQDTYSANREQRIQERAKKMQELQQQTSEASLEFQILKTASNPLTRAWAHIVAPFGSEKGKRDRLSLLRSLAKIDSSLKEVEDQILSGDPSILNALHSSSQLYLEAKSTFFDQFRTQLSDMIQSTNAEFEKLKQEVKDLKEKNKIDDLVGTPGSLVTGPVTMPPGPDPKPIDKGKGKGKGKTEKETGTAIKGDETSPAAAVAATTKALDKLISRTDSAAQEAQRASTELITGKVTMVDSERGTENVTPENVTPENVTPENGKPISSKDEEALQFGLGTKDIDLGGSSEGIDLDIEPREPRRSEPEVKQQEEHLEQPSVDVHAIRVAMITYIVNSVSAMYSEVSSEFTKYFEAPDPWFDRLQSLWNDINKAVSVIQASPRSDRKWIDAYLSFARAVGNWNANIYVLKHELKAAELKPDFTFGSTINEAALTSQVKQFVQSHWENLLKFIPSNGSLVSEGSDRFTRFLKRMKTHLSWGPDKNLRLLAAERAREARQGLQAMMNDLESRHINFRRLIANSEAFYNSFIGMYDKLADLGKSYNSRMMVEKSKRKLNKERMKYDLIRETDIRDARNIRDSLTKDRDAIKSLDSLESKFSEIQSQLENLKSQIKE